MTTASGVTRSDVRGMGVLIPLRQRVLFASIVRDLEARLRLARLSALRAGVSLGGFLVRRFSIIFGQDMRSIRSGAAWRGHSLLFGSSKKSSGMSTRLSIPTVV